MTASSATSSSTSVSSSSKGGLSSGAIGGIIGGGIGVLALGGIAVFCLWRRRKNSQAGAAISELAAPPLLKSARYINKDAVEVSPICKLAEAPSTPDPVELPTIKDYL